MKDQTLSLIITPIDDRIDIEVSGTLEHTDGMLEEFTSLNVELIEKQSKSKKQMERTTLLINGKKPNWNSRTCATGNSNPPGLSQLISFSTPKYNLESVALFIRIMEFFNFLDKFVPAESVVVDSYDENQLTQRCWRVDNVLLN